jgi:hypothetical protein
MSKKEKLLKKFLLKPNDFTFKELMTLLKELGYREIRSGKSSGSRVAFINESTRHIIRLHKPHPRTILQRYQLDYVEEELKNRGVLK